MNKLLWVVLIVALLCAGCGGTAAAAKGPVLKEVQAEAVGQGINIAPEPGVIRFDITRIVPQVRLDGTPEGVYYWLKGDRAGIMFDCTGCSNWMELGDGLYYRFVDSILELKYDPEKWTYTPPTATTSNVTTF